MHCTCPTIFYTVWHSSGISDNATVDFLFASSIARKHLPLRSLEIVTVSRVRRWGAGVIPFSVRSYNSLNALLRSVSGTHAAHLSLTNEKRILHWPILWEILHSVSFIRALGNCSAMIKRYLCCTFFACFCHLCIQRVLISGSVLKRHATTFKPRGLIVKACLAQSFCKRLLKHYHSFWHVVFHKMVPILGRSSIFHLKQSWPSWHVLTSARMTGENVCRMNTGLPPVYSV